MENFANFIPSDSEYGISVDLRYDAVAFYIVNLKSKDILTAGNTRYGEDMISSLNNAIKSCCDDYLIEEDEIKTYAVCGSEENLSLFTSTEKGSSLFGIEERASKLGLYGNKSATVFVSPCSESEISGDMISVLSYFDFDNTPDNSLFIDFAEITQCVFKKSDEIISMRIDSPIMETKGISFGTIAESGAIHQAEIKPDGTIKYSTRNNVLASGVFVTGLVDIIAVNLKKGVISDDKKVENGKIDLLDEKYLLQSDIDLFFKNAMSLSNMFSSICDGVIPNVYLSGCYGTQFNPENLINSGILPASFTSAEISVIANASGLGMIKCLYDDNEKDKMILLSEKIK